MMQSGNKTGLRKQIRQARRRLTPTQQKAAAGDLLTQLKTVPEFHAAKRTGMYIANDGEIDLGDTMKWCWEQARRCYVPMIRQHNPGILLFAEVTENTCFVPNRFNIPEPCVTKDEMVSAEQLDLVLLPLVGFDMQGNRIGMGGGFYDTTFEFVTSAGDAGPTLIGIAHELQQVLSIDAESWDVPLSMVVTDSRTYRFDTKSLFPR